MDPAQAFSSAFNSSFDKAQSISQRAQEQQQNQSQFNVVENLRRQQFDLQKQTSMAQLAAISTDQKLKSIQIQQAQMQLDQVPLQKQAGVDFQNIVNEATQKSTNSTEWDSLVQSKAASNPDLVRNFPGGITGYNSAVLSSRNSFLNTQAQQIQIKKANDDLQTDIDAENLGVDKNNFLLAAEDGSASGFDRSAYKQAVQQAKDQRDLGVFGAKENIKEDNRFSQIQQVYEGKRNVAQVQSESRKESVDKRSSIKESLDKRQAIEKEALQFQKAALQYSPGQKGYDELMNKYEDKIRERDSILSPPSETTKTEPKQSVGGYKIGMKYGNPPNMTYLGGDPNAQSSWKSET